MPTYPSGGRAATFQTVLDSFACAPGLPFQEVLTAERIQALAAEEQVDFGSAPGDVYSVPVTLWAFLAQVLSKEKACVAAVARVLVLRVALGLPPCASETGAYCKARAKLPEPFLQRLCYDVAEQVEGQAPAAWLWKGRHVFIGDGSTLSMPDTPENQEAYPHPRTQKRGLGFPILRVVVLLALATAVLTGAAFGPYVGKNQGEPALLRTLLARLRPGDVLLGDRYYCSYWLVALAQRLGVDVVYRQHQRRASDFRRGVQLGPLDHVVVWTRPKRPDWLDEATYQALPATLTVRELRVRVSVPGYRTKDVTVVTTLVDAAAYAKDDIADLYRTRWHVELDLRAIKTHLRMDILRCKTPAMVRKEIWAHFLAYNLTRRVLAAAAAAEGVCPRDLSFLGAVQTLNEFRWLLVTAGADVRGGYVRVLWVAVASHRVGDRPERCEPRAVKRRPKPLRYLTEPRAAARAKLLKGRRACRQRRRTGR
jgi:DDE family transposase